MTGKELVITEFDFDRLNGLVRSRNQAGANRIYLDALQRELGRSRVVGADDVPTGTVTMHSRVKIRDMKTKKTETYTLVYPEEADLDEGRLSILAPLGTAILGTRVNDIVRWRVPAGERTLKIEKILYQPEAAGDLHL